MAGATGEQGNLLLSLESQAKLPQTAGAFAFNDKGLHAAQDSRGPRKVSFLGNFIERAFSLKVLFSSPGRSRLDDCTQGNSHAVTCSPDSTSDGLTRGQCMRECRSFPCSPMLDRDGLDPTAEKRVLLFQPIQRRVQVRDNCLSLISDDDQFDIDLFV